MEIELNAGRNAVWIGIAALLAVVLLTAVGVLGYAVTPREGGEVLVLTPSRWKANALAREVAAEVNELVRDAGELGALLEGGREKPVEATMLAQRIYARHRNGTATTAAAREALIEAARLTALWASGAASHDEAAQAYNEALRRIEVLAERYVDDE